MDFIHDFDSIYLALCAHIRRLSTRADPGVVLSWVQLAANFAWRYHTGRFADGRLENIALDVGRELDRASSLQMGDDTFDIPEIVRSTGRQVLHVATHVQSIGGHTRLFLNWMANDPESRHFVVLINQHQTIPYWVYETVSRTGGGVIVLPPNASLLLKAKWLREIGRSVDIIILHHHNDVVPVAAFAAPCPPVAIMDQADHVFWLGSSIADTIIEHRVFGEAVSRERRFPRHLSFLPIPLNPVPPGVSRAEARKRLDIPDAQVMLLSMGRVPKYRPMANRDFFQTSLSILERNPGAHLYLIGVAWDQKTRYLRKARHERLHLLGVIEDPTLYEIAADIYLEGFPATSCTAMLEASALGVCPVPQFAPLADGMFFEDIAWTGMLDHLATEEEYIEEVSALIRNRDERIEIGRQVAEKVRKHHIGRRWHDYLQAIYGYLGNTVHNPGPIPVSNCVETATDRILSTIRITDRRPPDALLREARKDLSREALHRARHCMNRHQYGVATRDIALALRMNPLRVWELFRPSIRRWRKGIGR